MSAHATASKDSSDAAADGAMKEIWDSVTEGAFDHLHLDMFFVVTFLVIVSSFPVAIEPS